jgi:hypothetical protein
MRLDEILRKIPENKFAVVGLDGNSASDPEAFFIEGPADEDNFYDSFVEARAVAVSRFRDPQNIDEQFFTNYWVYDNKGQKLFDAYANGIKHRKRSL